MMSADLQRSLSAAPSLEGEYCKNKTRQTSSGKPKQSRRKITENWITKKLVFQFDIEVHIGQLMKNKSC